MNFIALCLLLLFSIEVSGQCHTIGAFLDLLASAPYQVTTPKTFKKTSGFDFISFTPIETTRNSPNDYFIVGYDENGAPVSVEHMEKAPRLSVFKMLKVDLPNYSVYFLKQPERDAFHPVVFVLTKNSNRRYFIGASPQKGFEVQKMLLDEMPIMSIQSITSVMLLDDQFFPTETLRFHNGQLFMATTIVYREGSRFVEREEASIYHPYFGGLPLNLNRDICMDVLNELPKTYTPLRFSLEPNILEPNREMPLWVWGGSHDYFRK